MEVLVTSYKNPDVDGVACTLGYAAFLCESGIDAHAAISGTVHPEAQFAMGAWDMSVANDADTAVRNVDKIILVDISDVDGLSDEVRRHKDKVIEVVDHRKVHNAHLFPHARVHIENVGAAATLIAEKFFTCEVMIPRGIAGLLFSAIISNTVNLKAAVTIRRDHAMVQWLKTQCAIPDDYIYRMFAHKSHLCGDVESAIAGDFAQFHCGTRRIGIAQLEIMHVGTFVQENARHIKDVLKDLKKKNALDVVFLTCIDVVDAFNMFVVVDAVTQKVLERILNITFSNNCACRDGIIMRKEIVPLLCDMMK